MTGTAATWVGAVEGELQAEQPLLQRSTAPGALPDPSAGDALAAAMAGAVEQHLARYLGGIAVQMDDARREAQTDRAALRRQIEHIADDRLPALEARLAVLAADLRALVDGRAIERDVRLDDANRILCALSQQVEDLTGSVEARLTSATSDTHRLLTALSDRLDAQPPQVDAAVIEDVRDRLSKAVGEAMLVRIEMDRAVNETSDKLDRQSLRMAVIETQMANDVDVSVAVQLERLDELERAIAELDPAQFVRCDGRPSGGSDNDPTVLAAL